MFSDDERDSDENLEEDDETGATLSSPTIQSSDAITPMSRTPASSVNFRSSLSRISSTSRTSSTSTTEMSPALREQLEQLLNHPALRTFLQEQTSSNVTTAIVESTDHRSANSTTVPQTPRRRRGRQITSPNLTSPPPTTRLQTRRAQITQSAISTNRSVSPLPPQPQFDALSPQPSILSGVSGFMNPDGTYWFHY